MKMNSRSIWNRARKANDVSKLIADAVDAALDEVYREIGRTEDEIRCDLGHDGGIDINALQNDVENLERRVCDLED